MNKKNSSNEQTIVHVNIKKNSNKFMKIVYRNKNCLDYFLVHSNYFYVHLNYFYVNLNQRI